MSKIIDLGKLRFYFAGEYDSGTTYEINDVVKYGGNVYVYTYGLKTSGNAPTNTTFWSLMVEGFTFEGVYAAENTYQIGDVVSYGGSVYIATTLTQGNEPTNTAYWSTFVDGIQWEGTYNNATAYQENDVVVYGGSTYIATQDTTGNVPTNTTYWDVLNPGVSPQGAWATSAAYYPNDLVTYGGNTYKALTAHSSGTFATDLSNGNWEKFNGGVDWKGDWATGTDYKVDDLVKNGVSTYIVLEDHTSGTFATDLSASKLEIFAQGGDYAVPDPTGATNEFIGTDGSAYVFFDAATARTNMGLPEITSTSPTAGQVLAYDAVTSAYINTTASSGGGSQATLVNTEVWGMNSTVSSGSHSYGSNLIRRGGQRGNIFGAARMCYNNSGGNTGTSAFAFTIDPSTGNITRTHGGNTQSMLWQNNSGSANSTTYFNHPYGTGGLFYGGHNAWPGQSSHAFGYGTAYLDGNGSWNHLTASYTNNDHGYNGFFTSIPDSGSNTEGRQLSGGYNSSSRGQYRVNNFANTSWSVGGSSQFNTDTSTTYGVSFIPNADTTISNSTQPVSALEYRINSTNYRIFVTNANGSTSEFSIPDWTNNTEAYLTTSGNVFLYSGIYQKKFTSYNSASDITYRSQNATSSYTSGRHVKQNKFIRLANTNNTQYGISYFEIDSSTGEMTILQNVNIPYSFMEVQGIAQPEVIFDSNNNPVYIIIHSRYSHAGNQVRVFEWPFTD